MQDLENIDNELIIHIMKYLGLHTVYLSYANKSMYNRISEVTDYFFKPYRITLLPVDTSSLTQMLCVLDKNTFRGWGKINSTMEKERSLCNICKEGSVTDLNHIMSLGVDIDCEILCFDSYSFQLCKTPIEISIKYDRQDMVDYLMEYHVDLNIVAYSTIFESLPVVHTETTTYIIRKILKRFIALRYYDIFFLTEWRHDEQMFVLFGEALFMIPYGAVTGYSTSCDVCSKATISSFLCNGYLVCEECRDSKHIAGDLETLAASPNVFFGKILTYYDEILTEYELSDGEESDDDSIQWEEEESVFLPYVL